MEREVIRKIVAASGVEVGELVLIHFWGEDEEKSIANDFLAEVTALGATPFLLQQARSTNKEIFTAATDSCFDERFFSIFDNFDAVLDVFTYQPVILGYEIEEKQFNLYRRYMAMLFEKFLTRKRFTQIRIPNTANAAESGLEPEDFIRRMTDAYNIDYDELKVRCLSEQERLSSAEHIILRTGADCELQFTLSDREWHIDAGDGDWPCGEIYVAPLEQETNGRVYFEKLHIKNTGTFDDVTLRIENGRVMSSSAEDVNAFLATLKPEDSVVCELGFGMNRNIRSLCGYTVLDEKMADTFHIAIGANTMFGGENASSIHVDFVGVGEIEILDYKEGS